MKFKKITTIPQPGSVHLFNYFSTVDWLGLHESPMISLAISSAGGDG